MACCSLALPPTASLISALARGSAAHTAAGPLYGSLTFLGPTSTRRGSPSVAALISVMALAVAGCRRRRQQAAFSSVRRRGWKQGPLTRLVAACTETIRGE